MALESHQPLKLAPAPNLNASGLLSPIEGSPKKKASVACSACQKRKSRCTDGIPCQACKVHGTQCIKDGTEDMRRRLAVKKRLDSADVDRKLLDSLLELLRFGFQEQTNSLINLIRSNAPRQDLQAFIDDGYSVRSLDSVGTELVDGDSQLPYHYPRRRHRTGGISDLINPPIQVPAKPWTTVVDDDDFVSRLISLWFTWAHQWWHWVDKVYFLEAMRTQDLNNPLCAPYLVNMILADACLLDTIEEDEDEPHSCLRDQFYAEAKKGLEAEEGRISLTIVQATGVQWTFLDMNGQDKVGLLVLSEQVFMSKELDKYQERISKDRKISPETLSKIDQSINCLKWALFTLNAFTLVGSRRAHTIDPPQRPLPHHSHDVNPESRTWMPYPRQAPQVKFHEGCHRACVVSLARKAYMNEISFIESEENTKGGADEMFGVKQKLKDWAGSMPSCMQLHENAMPHVIALHAMHNWIILTLGKQAAAAAAGPSTGPTATSTPESSATSYWQQDSVSAAVTIGHLMDLLITKWGVENFPVILVHPISLALVCLLDNVEHEGRKKAFVSMCVALRAASRRFRVGKGILKLVKSTAKDREVTLPKETEGLFYFERRSRGEPTGSDQWEEDPTEGIGMQYLLEKWDDLNLDEY